MSEIKQRLLPGKKTPQTHKVQQSVVPKRYE